VPSVPVLSDLIDNNSANEYKRVEDTKIKNVADKDFAVSELVLTSDLFPNSENYATVPYVCVCWFKYHNIHTEQIFILKSCNLQVIF